MACENCDPYQLRYHGYPAQCDRCVKDSTFQPADIWKPRNVHVVKLADTQDRESCAVRRAGSTPVVDTLKPMKISFDFDETLAVNGTEPIDEIVDVLRSYHALGLECVIVTARSDTFENRWLIEAFLHDNGLTDKVSQIVFTNHTGKGPYAKELGVTLHYDDSQFHLDSLREYGIRTIDTAV